MSIVEAWRTPLSPQSSEHFVPAPKTITVHLPRELRAYCGGAARLAVPEASIRAVLHALERDFPLVYRGVCDETGAVRRHINIFVNTHHMRDREGLDTPLRPGDEVTILPAVSGGAA